MSPTNKTIDDKIISEEEFIKILKQAFEYNKQSIGDLKYQQEELLKLYKEYIVDKQNYILTYKLKDGSTLVYTKEKKPTIGFKLRGQK